MLSAQSSLAAADNTEGTNLAVVINGKTTIKRKGWNRYSPIVFGTRLELGDLLNIGESSELKVLCSDLRLHDVPAGISGVPCPSFPGVLHRADGSIINPTRSLPRDGSYPVVIL